MSRRKLPREFKATFENGGFWEYYLDMERQFQDFLEHVPYLDKNKGVCSFRLVNLLLSIGGHVDSAFKEMAFYPKFSKNEKCKEIRQKVKETRKRIRLGQSPKMVKIKDCLSAFEMEYDLSKRQAEFKRLLERDVITPFTSHNRKTNAPKWWDVYNGLKHDFGNNFEKANLHVTRDALAGAFLLNAIHFPSVFRLYEFGVIKIEPEPDVTGGMYSEWIPTLEWVKREYEERGTLPTCLETPLFVYDYHEGWEDDYE